MIVVIRFSIKDDPDLPVLQMRRATAKEISRDPDILRIVDQVRTPIGLLPVACVVVNPQIEGAGRLEVHCDCVLGSTNAVTSQSRKLQAAGWGEMSCDTLH